MIHTELYLAKLKTFIYDQTKVHVEVITRVQGHILSPSWNLLTDAKQHAWKFITYASALLSEWFDQLDYPFWIMPPSAPYQKKVHAELKRLRTIAETKDLYLICYEKDRTRCHREIVKALLLGFTPTEILNNIRMNENRLIIN
jgi:hypothetical protein